MKIDRFWYLFFRQTHEVFLSSNKNEIEKLKGRINVCYAALHMNFEKS